MPIKKSAVMIYRSMTLKGCTISNFKLNGMILHVVASYKGEIFDKCANGCKVD